MSRLYKQVCKLWPRSLFMSSLFWTNPLFAYNLKNMLGATSNVLRTDLTSRFLRRFRLDPTRPYNLENMLGATSNVLTTGFIRFTLVSFMAKDNGSVYRSAAAFSAAGAEGLLAIPTRRWSSMCVALTDSWRAFDVVHEGKVGRS